MTTYEENLKLESAMNERKQQKLNPPKFTENLVSMSKSGLWLSGIESSESVSYKNNWSIIICFGILAACLIGYCLLGGSKL